MTGELFEEGLGPQPPATATARTATAVTAVSAGLYSRVYSGIVTVLYCLGKPAGSPRCFGAADMTRTLVAYALAAALLASSAHAQSLLPSQESRNFFGVRICRDRQILSAVKTGATNALKTKVIVAHGDGPDWSGYQPDDIRLEGVLADQSAVFCSVTISANEITERVVYVVSPDPDHSWLVELGGDYGPGSGSHILFPRQWKITPAPPPTTLPVPQSEAR
jgi:hypothetical protein